MDEAYFSERLATLRKLNNVSAREMSLALGQNSSYINRIENRLAYPSMQNFFYICDYLGVTPAEFFDEEKVDPTLLRDVYKNLSHLDAMQLQLVNAIIIEMVNR